MKRTYQLTTLSLALLLATAMLAPPGAAAAAIEVLSQTPLSDSELAVLRGGFATSDGMLISFGIDRATYVNGVLDSASSFTVSQAKAGSSAPLQASNVQGNNALQLIQVGPPGANIFNQAANAAPLTGTMTVIQNSLSQQVIKSSTILNASLANMGLFHDLNLSAALRQQMISAIR